MLRTVGSWAVWYYRSNPIWSLPWSEVEWIIVPAFDPVVRLSGGGERHEIGVRRPRLNDGLVTSPDVVYQRASVGRGEVEPSIPRWWTKHRFTCTGVGFVFLRRFADRGHPIISTESGSSSTNTIFPLWAH